MKSLIKFNVLTLTFVFLVTLVISSFAQEGGGGLGYGYIDRARNAAGQPLPGGPPPGISPEDFARFQAGNQALTGQPGQPQPAPPPEIKLITVIEGERIICAKSGKILQEPERKQVPETLKDNYYDDGTHGDEVANDGIYSNIIERKDVISKEEYKQRLMMETLIDRIVKDNPVEFYRLYVASDGHSAEIPSYSYWRSRRDEFINDYKSRILAPYKDENGNFYEVYEPPAPVVPIVQQAPGQGQFQGPQNVGLPTAIQGQLGQPNVSAGYGGDNFGVGGSSYFGERNK